MSCVPFTGCPKPSPLSRARSWVLLPQFSPFGLKLAKLWAWTIFHFLKKAIGGVCFDVIPRRLALGHVSFVGTRSETWSHGGKYIHCPIWMSAALLKFLMPAVTSKVFMRSELGENIHKVQIHCSFSWAFVEITSLGSAWTLQIKQRVNQGLELNTRKSSKWVQTV